MSENYGLTTETNSPDNLLYGDFPQVTEDVTIQSGAGVVVRGTVLGKITASVPATGTADVGNTGDGTMSGVAAKRYTKTGIYTAECITAVTNAGVFKITDPDGNRLKDATVAVAYDEDQIKFIINDGATDFIVGDKFTVTVAVGSRECVAVDSGNADGSQSPYAVLLKDVDATSEAVRSVGALSGDFNERALVFGGTDTIETHRAAMRDISLFAHASQPFVDGSGS